jgi:hypothetical protein
MMICLASAFSFFLLVILTHVLFFRLRLMQFQMERFFVICLIWGAVNIAYLFWTVRLAGEGTGALSSCSTNLIFSSIAVYGLLCMAYLAQCTGIQVESPSMKIIGLIQRDRRRGITHEELQRCFTDEELVLARLDDLVRCGYVLEEGGVYRLTQRGSGIAGFFGAYQRMIRRNMRG